MNLIPFKVSDFLKAQEDIIEYLNAVLEDGDADELAAAIKEVADAMGYES
jgi:DNA-binding phage protein